MMQFFVQQHIIARKKQFWLSSIVQSNFYCIKTSAYFRSFFTYLYWILR